MRDRAVALLILVAMVACVSGRGQEPEAGPSDAALRPPGATSATLTPSVANADEMTLVPYASSELGVTGVRPAGWLEFSPGHFQPARPATVPTLFAQLRLPGPDAQLITEKLAQMRSSGRLEREGRTWELYVRHVVVPDEKPLMMEIALSELDGVFCAAVLGSLPEEHEGLRQAILLPALERLQPVPEAGHGGEARPQATVIPPLDSSPPVLETRTRPADGMVIVYVPAGEFQMGQDTVWRWSGSLLDGSLGLTALTDQRPQHTVYLDGFWIDQTEVTTAMFRVFVADTGYVTTAERQGYGHPYRAGPREQEWPQVAGADWLHPRGPGSQARDDHPVVQVSWDDATAYCAWAGGSLPTEAQWEKACRGTDERRYPWGSEFDPRRLNYCDAGCPVERWRDPGFDDGYGYISPVGAYPEGGSPYGALDMAGNVWEWTADRYDSRYYGKSPRENPTGSETGVKRVQHGGAWVDGGPSGWLTCTIRHATIPENTADDLGFRCAIPAEQDASLQEGDS